MRYAGLLVVIAATAATLGYSLVASSSSTAASQNEPGAMPIVSPPRDRDPALLDRPRRPQPGVRVAPTRAQRGLSTDVLRSEPPGALGEADGAVPDGTTVFDHEIPGIANLDPALLRALRQAATDAADDGIEFFVNSGWRSPDYQEQLLHEAVSKYGSEEEAARWVATPTTSSHVSGDAVDIGPFDATAWLSEHGAKYGLCQIYSNESWHYELLPQAIDRGCPPMYADPTHDPRLRQRMSWPASATGRSASSSRASTCFPGAARWSGRSAGSALIA